MQQGFVGMMLYVTAQNTDIISSISVRFHMPESGNFFNGEKCKFVATILIYVATTVDTQDTQTRLPVRNWSQDVFRYKFLSLSIYLH